MATTIKLKNGSGVPLAGDLVQGEPALDLTNKRLYTEDSGGTVIEIGTNPSTLSIAGTAITATAEELNYVDGVTSNIQAQIDALGTVSSLEDLGVTATAAEVNVLDGITATTAELNYTDGVTSNIQTQLDAKVGASYTGDVDITGELLADSYNETFKQVSSVATTVGYNLAAATQEADVSIAAQETAPRAVEFKTDGTKMYIVGSVNDTVFQYSLSTAWDVSTATYDSKSFSVASEQTVPDGIRFKPDGTKFYILGDTPDSVHQYSMSTAWDISTASYDSVTFSVGSQTTQPQGIFFKPDGTKFYVCDNTNDSVYQYALSTAWDLSTASYESKSFSVASQETSPSGLNFNPDGTKMWIIGFGTNYIHQYSLSTAWDVSTASYDSVNFTEIPLITSSAYDFTIGNNGTKFYVVEVTNDYVWQYDWSTTSASTTFDCENANVFETVLDANTTVVFSNPPAAGTSTDSTAYAMSLKVIQDASASGYTVTWPTSVDWPSATAPTLTSTASAVDQFVFYTHDGGTTWYGFTAGQALG